MASHLSIFQNTSSYLLNFHIQHSLVIPPFQIIMLKLFSSFVLTVHLPSLIKRKSHRKSQESLSGWLCCLKPRFGRVYCQTMLLDLDNLYTSSISWCRKIKGISVKFVHLVIFFLECLSFDIALFRFQSSCHAFLLCRRLCYALLALYRVDFELL